MARPGKVAAWSRDGVTALLWTVAVVPPTVGFWLVAGSVAGVAPTRIHLLIMGSLLGLAMATVLQVAFGFRLPIYEGPASAYLAALTVVSAEGHHGPSAITGGLLTAAVFVALLGILRVDRLITSVFTPLVGNVFLLTISAAVMPATLQRAVGATHGLPGSGVAWAATAVVVAVTLAMRRVDRLEPYVLLAALMAGTATYVGLAGAPHIALRGGVVTPHLLPWGAPQLSVDVVIPYMIAATLAAFNTIASGTMVARVHDIEMRPAAPRRALIMHGAAQAAGAVVGSLVGTVSRLESVGIVRLINHRGRAPLVLMGILLGALAFVAPFVALTTALPLSVSAALLGVILALMVAQALTGIAGESSKVRALVVLPSLVPSVVWIAFGSSLSPTAQLIANPMLWGVLMAMLLERLVAPRLRQRSVHSTGR